MSLSFGLSLTITMFALTGCAGGIQQDKVGHFVVGAGVSIVATELGATPLQACAASLVVGVAKEAYDSKYGGIVETMDALATVSGCVLTWEF